MNEDTREHYIVSETTNKTHPWLNFDAFEQTTKNAIGFYLFLRQNVGAVKHILIEQVHKILLPKVYIHELVEVSSMHNKQKIANLKRKTDELMTNPYEITNSARCINAWLTLTLFEYRANFWEEIKF